MVRNYYEGKDFYLSWKFITSFCSLLRLLYPRFEYVAILTIFTLIAAGGYEFVSYRSGTITGDFYMALQERNESYFWNLFWKATLIYLGQCLLLASTTFLTWLLYICMRRNLVDALHKMYFRKNAYYQLNSVDKAGIDNPDQRITQDAERMCSTLAKNIFPYILISPGVIGYYTYKTWVIAGPFGVAIIYTYFIIGVIANRLLVSPLTKWTARVERAEGDFRYKHVSVRNNAEESAFYNAAQFDLHESDRFFTTLLKTQLTSTLWKYPAQFLQNFFDYYGGVLSYVIQVFPIFIFHSYDNMDPATLSKQISNNAFYFIYLINSFTRLTDLAMNIGEMAGYSQRVAELVRYLENNHEEKTSFWSCGNGDESPDLLVTEKLSFSVPNDPTHLITEDLDLRLPKGKTLLITGGSGIGKTSLLRVVKKLWEPCSGTIIRNFTHTNAMFLPQRPYFPPGSLSIRQQIIFPRLETEVQCLDLESDRIVKILHLLNLKTLISMCGSLTDPATFEWQDTLSPGEQQRLSIARVLFHRPPFVFLDEATSSLSMDAEEIVYTLLQKEKITYISTGHRTSLKQYHDLELHRHEKNGWQLATIEDRKP
uniref:ATP-binding cassette sub-family D member 4 n=1 Tax=Haemonchus contortus TaxID=6289 RepID=A0A7I4YSN7_HAECO